MFFKVLIGTVSTANVMRLVGGGGKQLLSKKESFVQGCREHCFAQFLGSPHVRYPKLTLYQGEWSGLPLVTELQPHGEGLVMLLSGWGVAKEDKVVYIEIVECRHLNQMDINGSDPYCEIHCNGAIVQTSIKWDRY